jgi:phospholipid/cholesterol/gamma-HCH transport system ATP-binding protein
MTNRADETAIEVKGVEVGFGSHLVLRGVDLAVHRGEVMGLVGGSGSGKSVLLRTLIGLIKPARGSIRILGQNTSGLDEEAERTLQRRWGVLFQQGALFSSLTVLENVEFPMRERLSLSAAHIREVALAKLAMVGLNHSDAGKMPSELSGGMTKRAALARALALDPELVFLDEPTSGLDPISAAEFDTLIKALRQMLNLTVFMVTHDLDSLETVCDRAAALVRGRIAAVGPARDLRHSTDAWVAAFFSARRTGDHPSTATIVA